MISVGRYLRLVFRGKLRLQRVHLGKMYKIENAGTFKVFRDTFGNDGAAGQPVVLVVGFRLKVIRSISFLHGLFQRVCILTTPFWSGFKGFRIKLWLVDPQTKDYLGIYKWTGEVNAKTYADNLSNILRPLSVKNSVWYKIHNENFDNYLKDRQV